MTNKELDTSVEYLHSKGFTDPEIGIVLGSGLGRMVDEIGDPKVAHYHNIPNFPLATVEFHRGKLLYGQLGSKKAVVMQGRFHQYEGYQLTEVTYPIRVMHQLGIKKLLISNAAGALNPRFRKGDLMLIDDHINLQGDSPLAFKNVSDFGERFVDMSCPYDPDMSEKLAGIAREFGIGLHKGVYAAMTGPQLETRAEYRMLRMLGADAVGMSTVPEVIVARHMGLPCFAMSVITDLGVPGRIVEVTHEEVQTVARKAEATLTKIFTELVRQN